MSLLRLYPVKGDYSKRRQELEIFPFSATSGLRSDVSFSMSHTQRKGAMVRWTVGVFQTQRA